MSKSSDVQKSVERMKIHMELRGLRPNTVSGPSSFEWGISPSKNPSTPCSTPQLPATAGSAGRIRGLAEGPASPAARGRLRRSARLPQSLAAPGHSPTRGPEHRCHRQRHHTARGGAPSGPAEALSLRHPLPLPPMGRPHAPDLRPDRRPVPCLRGPHEVARLGPRQRQHRALPAPPGPLVTTARAHRGPSPALPALRNPPSPLPTRRAQLRHLSPEVALDTARNRRLPDGG